jgi:hypothetical protein
MLQSKLAAQALVCRRSLSAGAVGGACFSGMLLQFTQQGPAAVQGRRRRREGAQLRRLDLVQSLVQYAVLANS